MTTPVLVEMNENAQEADKNTYKMGFYIDKNTYPDVAKIPEPKLDGTYLKKIPATKFYVRRYGGYSNRNVLAEEAEKLKASLRELGLKFNESEYRFAGYDPPFKPFGRRNEVLIEALE
ncbi:Heme-binding protein 2 [Cichlidogyrus casuarinus]|uniref:Heme-binding protein 2 n=1 Tax=Cichlidogyrus casuarinus TaxID=1844966 RepID=A0ABD2Q729_9PLAT